MKISIRFSLASAKTEELPIRMRISYDGQRLDLRTGHVCHPDKWDADAGRVRPGTTNRYKESASTINRNLSAMESVIVEILQRYEINHVIPTPAVVKYDFDTAMGRKTKDKQRVEIVTLPSLFKKYMIEHGKSGSLVYNTVLGYSTVLKHIEDMPWADKSVEDITHHDLSVFINQLLDKEVENRTILGYITKIKSVLKWSKVSSKEYNGSLHEEFRPKLKGADHKEVHYLEWEEFEKMLYVRLDTKKLESVRDAFCFCCATGLRVSDCSKLKWRDVDLKSETPHISVLIKKTSTPVVIELNKYSRAIIDRNIHGMVDPNNTVFEDMPIQTRNRRLCEIAKAAGITSQCRQLSFVGNKISEEIVNKADVITTHWARHTFVVHALHLGIPPNVIMAWTGHSSYDSLKPYIDITNKTKVEKMSLFDK